MKKSKLFYTSVIIVVIGCAIIGKNVLAEGEKFSYDDVIRLEKVVSKISEFYVEEVKSEELVQSAIEGMRDILDPHTAYFSEKDYTNLKVSTEGAFGGLGITIAIRDHILTVISPLHGTPAYRMGLQAGDRILEIEGKTTKNITVDQAVDQLRGKPGTEVTIKIIREGAVEPMDFKIERAIIQIKSVPFYTLVDDSIGYVKVTQFSKMTGKELEEKIEVLKKQGAKTLILDLRNNPGGLLNQAIEVSSTFVGDKKLVVYTKGRTSSQNNEYFSGAASAWNKKLIVLVNGGSASASEIVAGAIQDHDRGLILGKTTFGKGSVQTILPLDAQKYALKLTTAYYYTPSGRCINKPENAVKFISENEDEEGVKTDTSKDSVKYFYTDAGRKVFAAGGVTPDVDIDGNLYNRYIRELERRTLFFKYIIKHRAEIEKQGSVSLKYQVSDATVKEFETFVYLDTAFTQYKSAAHFMLTEFNKTLESEQKSLGDTLKTNLNSELTLLQKSIEDLLVKKSRMLFDQNKDYVSYALKRELLQAVVGDSARNYHELSTDVQFNEAVKYLKNNTLYHAALIAQKEDKKVIPKDKKTDKKAEKK